MLDVGRLAVLQWPLEIFAFLFLLVGVLYPYTQWGTLPDRVPSHFDFRGRPDHWSGRGVFLWFALLEVFRYGIFSLQGGTLDHITGARPFYHVVDLILLWTKTVVTGLFAYLNWTIVRVARGQAGKANLFVLLGISALLVLPLVLLPKR